MPAGPDAPGGHLGELTQRWAQEALHRGARWFGIACACLPMLVVLDAHSVLDALLAGLAVGAWPGVPLRVWGLLLWFAGCGVAAGRLMGWLGPRARMHLFVGCLVLYAGFAVVVGGWLRAGVGLGCFGACFVALRGAREGS